MILKPARSDVYPTALLELAGCGHVPFKVVGADIDFRIGQSAVVVTADFELPRRRLITFEIVVEDAIATRRYRGLRRWRGFLLSLGFNKTVDDTDELIGRRAAIHVNGGSVSFVRTTTAVMAA